MIPVARSMLAVSSFILVGAVLCLFLVEPGTAEFVVTCLALGIGLIAVTSSMLVIRWSLQREHAFRKETQ